MGKNRHLITVGVIEKEEIGKGGFLLHDWERNRIRKQEEEEVGYLG
jgi:hypothetical protein